MTEFEKLTPEQQQKLIKLQKKSMFKTALHVFGYLVLLSFMNFFAATINALYIQSEDFQFPIAILNAIMIIKLISGFLNSERDRVKEEITKILNNQ